MMSTFSFRARLENFFARHHHAEIDDLVVVTAEHDADDVLADVVHVAFDRGHAAFALRLHGLARGGHALPFRLP